ncbi:LysR family transcriptional regulator [Marinobacterium jannaschii]|uniref:LysR family transcriptional regulator n=1 Tax=Marinobacterium jannaschii TaxID=64970 RepID=UPI000483E897|nr:LysR family transcriptional regulator [Marinobacterium jannaschii]
MDQLHLMQVFVAVAEEEGFTRAARRLTMSPPAVTRAITALEERLKVKLLNRTTRYVRVTDAGRHYLEDARRIIAQIDAANEAAAGIHAAPRGALAITAPAMFGRLYITPVIVEYLQRYPETEVDALFVDRVVNLLEEGLDVGIRIGELADSSMRALKVGAVRLLLCASPEYLKVAGRPETPDQLIDHQIISSSPASQILEWKFSHTRNERSVKVKPRLRVTTNDAALEAALSGFGITRLLSYQAAGQLAAGQLERVLTEFEPAPLPIHIVHREGRYASTRVRAFIELTAECLRQNRLLNPDS